MKSQESDRQIETIERELANPPKQEPASPASPPWQPVSGILGVGGAAARRTIANPKTHKA
jgi:hypothetical protein